MPGTSQNSYDLSLRKCLTAGRIFGPSTELCRPLPVTTSTFQVPANREHLQSFLHWQTQKENSCLVVYAPSLLHGKRIYNTNDTLCISMHALTPRQIPTDTQCCTSSALSTHHYRSRLGLHLNLDRSRIVFSISATASSTCSACRSTLNVLLTSAFLQKAPHFLSS